MSVVRGLWLQPDSGIAGDMFIGALLDLGLSLDDLRSALRGLSLEGFRLDAHAVRRGALRATKFDVIVRGADGRERVEGHQGAIRDHGAPGEGEAHPHTHGRHHAHAHRDDPAPEGDERSAAGALELPPHSHGRHDAHGRPDARAHGHVHDPAHGHDHDHGHDDDHEHAHGLAYREIRELIATSALSDRTRALAGVIFARLAAAEGRVHGLPADDVHFHEVGAVDSIVDVCGAAAALELLGIEEVICSEIAIGVGRATMAHGTMPLPAPATVELLLGLPLRRTTIRSELVTPTGAAILATITSRGEIPRDLRLLAVGYGAGSRDRAEPPNVLRALLYEREVAADPVGGSDAVVALDTQVDDMTGEELGHLRERLEAAGALDVVFQAVQMKKNRPGQLVSVLAADDAADAVEEALFRHATTFGVRRQRVERRVLERRIVEVQTRWGPARAKIGLRRGELLRCSAEYEDAARIARERALPLREVMAEIEGAARARLARDG